MQFKWIFFGIAILFLVACSNDSAQNVPLAELEKQQAFNQKQRLQKVLDGYQNYIDTALDSLHLPSLALAIVKDGKVIKKYIYGVTDVDSGEPINEQTVFRLASVSKGFAASLAGVLIEKNTFGWQDNIKDLVPNFKLKKKSHTDNITLLHSMSHTTGLVKHARSKTIELGKDYPAIFKSLRTAPIVQPLGKTYAYQNALFSVVSNIIKEKTTFSYEKMLDSLIFSPLQMPNISVGHTAMAANPNKAYPHIFSNKNNLWKKVNLRTKWYNVNPAAGVNASLADMQIWLNAMLGHYPKIISPTVLHQLFQAQIKLEENSGHYDFWGTDVNNVSYALGWRVAWFQGKKIIYHGGWIRGYRPEIGFCPQEDIGIVLLTNSNKNALSATAIPAFFKLYFAEFSD